MGSRPSAEQRTVAKAISVWKAAGIYLKGRSHQESDKGGVMTALRNGRDTENLDKLSRRKTETAAITRR